MEIRARIQRTADKATANLLPAKSANPYEAEYQKCIKWCEENKIREFSETTLLVYFQIKSEIIKASTLWTIYSVLKSTLGIKHNINHSKFYKLTAFLKRQDDTSPRSLKYLPVETFLYTAPDQRESCDYDSA
ncbi:hypothetical protein Zmor_006839 [Zophobas morio]|uniref:Uncharacterized protein n=1 Tax=Zophobas morio TaxID=2755281 RepID=A0AA38IVM5_9CUCU|nr:hypothetical protein Zmor_006839 [Zophobas morio]